MAGEGAIAAERSMLKIIGVDAVAKHVASGIHTTIDADDTIVTGLAVVDEVIISPASDPVDGAMSYTGKPSSTAGSIDIKGWKWTDGDATHVAASTFSKLVHWMAIGTM